MNKEDFTIFVRNLDEKVSEELLYELFLQAGPLNDVKIPSSNGVKRNYGFVEFKHEVSVPYAIHLLDGTRIFEKVIKLNSRSKCLHLFGPPKQCIRISRRPASDDEDDSSLRVIGGNSKKRFKDKSMLPSGSLRKSLKLKDESPPIDNSPSLRRMGGSLGKRFTDKSMLPSGSSKKFQRQDEVVPPNSWSPKHYPSQCDNAPEGYERSLSNLPRNKNNSHRGISNRFSSHTKPPYHNEKYHNDKKRFDSYSSQRPRHHRSFTR